MTAPVSIQGALHHSYCKLREPPRDAALFSPMVWLTSASCLLLPPSLVTSTTTTANLCSSKSLKSLTPLTSLSLLIKQQQQQQQQQLQQLQQQQQQQLQQQQLKEKKQLIRKIPVNDSIAPFELNSVESIPSPASQFLVLSVQSHLRVTYEIQSYTYNLTFKCLRYLFFFVTYILLSQKEKPIDFHLNSVQNYVKLYTHVILLLPVISGKSKVNQVDQENNNYNYNWLQLSESSEEAELIDSKSEVKFKNRLKSVIELSCQDLIT